MRYRCYAKVNLTLEVLRKRDDGFHDLASIVHTISLADDLSIEPAANLVVCTEGLALSSEDNLVTRAAQLLASATQTSAGAQLTLVKRIPAAAGLGGGSSDAAATLVGLNALWGTRLGYHALPRLALQLGSDVPFFLRGGAALMTGRGDELRVLRPLRSRWLVLITPALHIANKTAALYAALEPSDFSDGEATRRLADRLEQVDSKEFRNGFERPARAIFAGLDEMWRAAERRCDRRFCLSGAGPSLFTLAGSRAEAQHVAANLREAGLEAQAVRTVNHARATSKFSTRAAIEYA
jgi:4-diphosphocytidyl-2-C-methyl-D-erythritol kinase